MKKTIAVVVISLGLSVGALADETYTIEDTIWTVGQIPVKVVSHISMEIDKTKEFQKANWKKVKSNWFKLIAKFSSQ